MTSIANLVRTVQATATARTGGGTALRRYLSLALLYIVLIDISFVLLYPLLYIAVNSFKSLTDYLDPTVLWVPTKLYLANYALAYRGLEFWKALGQSMLITVPPALAQVLACSLTGYVFARYEFKGRDLLFALVLLTFVIPPETVGISQYMFYAKLKWLNTPWPFIAPAMLAQGLRGSLFVIIFRQFFKGLPWEIEEAARVDGAGPLRILRQIMLPMALPAMQVVFLFSFVWHWNDYYQPMLFFNKYSLFPLPMRVTIVARTLDTLLGSAAPPGVVNEPLMLAASAFVILPPLVLYLFAQRYFVEGLDRTGLVE